MLLGRRFDERCVNLQRRGLMFTLAPGIGQEACSVGSVIPLDRSRDWFVPQYREAAGQLHHGLPLVQAFLWHMGSPLGFCIHRRPENAAVQRRRRRPDSARRRSRLGPPPAGQRRCGRRPLRRRRHVAGRLSRGRQSRRRRQGAGDLLLPEQSTGRFPRRASCRPRRRRSRRRRSPTAFPGVQVDGNDLFAVVDVMREAVERARRGDGPTLIEGLTYRLGMHTTADDGARCEPRRHARRLAAEGSAPSPAEAIWNAAASGARPSARTWNSDDHRRARCRVGRSAGRFRRRRWPRACVMCSRRFPPASRPSGAPPRRHADAGDVHRRGRARCADVRDGARRAGHDAG